MLPSRDWRHIFREPIAFILNSRLCRSPWSIFYKLEESLKIYEGSINQGKALTTIDYVAKDCLHDNLHEDSFRNTHAERFLCSLILPLTLPLEIGAWLSRMVDLERN